MSHFVHHYEENYLKTLYKLSHKDLKKVNNIALAKAMNLNPATVLEMVRKLSERKLVQVGQDKSIQLTEKGQKKAILIIRKHRLWEVFLVEKLHYKWDEVHELAEQLEHIDSDDMIDRLDTFLGHPAYDPHGDPIPDKTGKVQTNVSIPLSDCATGKSYLVKQFDETSDSFLSYLNTISMKPGSRVKLLQKHEYDQSCTISIHKKEVHLSDKVARNILVQPTA